MEPPTLEPYVPFPSFKDFADGGFDDSTFAQFVAILEQAKTEATEDRLRSAVDKATKWAAIDTGAIEGLYVVERGFTFSVAAEATAWDNLHLVVGEEGGRAIQDALKAYEYVLDIATQRRPLTETWIRELHEVICASQKTYTVITSHGRQEQSLEKGVYKKHQNNPLNLAANTVHSYAAVEDTPAEMHRLVKELNSESFKDSRPVLQAAYAHYAFVCVHPFADGNGRVSRALSSIYLYRSPGVPLVIFADQKPLYLETLEAADAGDTRPFIQFIAERAIDVVRMVGADMHRRVRPSVSERMDYLRTSLLGRGGLPHNEIDALGSLLFDEFTKALGKAIVNNSVESPLNLKLQSGNAQAIRGLESFRHPPKSRSAIIVASSAAPATAQVVRGFGAMIAKAQSPGADFVIVSNDGTIVEEALIRDLVPVISPALVYRLDAAAEEGVLDLIDLVIEAGSATLKKSGYT